MTESTTWQDCARSRLAQFAAEAAGAQAAYHSLTDRISSLRLTAQRLAEQAVDHRRFAASVRGDNALSLQRAEEAERAADAAERAYQDAERQRAAAEQRSRPVIHRASEARQILLKLNVITGEAA